MTRATRITMIFAVLLLVPALVLEAAGMSKFYWSATNPLYLAFESVFSQAAGLSLLAQALVVAGPVLAIALAALPIVRVRVQREDSTVVGTVALKLSGLNLIVLACGVLAFGVIALYVIGENAPCILGYRVSC